MEYSAYASSVDCGAAVKGFPKEQNGGFDPHCSLSLVPTEGQNEKTPGPDQPWCLNPPHVMCKDFSTTHPLECGLEDKFQLSGRVLVSQFLL